MSEEQTFEETVEAFYPTEEAEPLDKPTAETEQDEAPEEATEELEDDSTEVAAEDDVSNDESEDDETNEDGDILVYEINDKEYTAKDIERLETNDKLRQADYTKKTTAHARQVEEDTNNLSNAITKTNDLASQLEVLIGEDNEINWDELEQDDPDEYIRLDKRRTARTAKFNEIKANNATTENSSFSPEAERVKLVEANPHWLDGDKPTKAYTDDMNTLSDYYHENGVTNEEAQFISKNARVVQLVLDEAKRKAKSKTTEAKKASTRKKIIKSPKATKPKAQANGLSAEEIFYGK